MSFSRNHFFITVTFTAHVASAPLTIWITPRLANCIKIKNKLYKSFYKEKDPHKKGKTILKDNSNHNPLLTLLRETKGSCYRQYFRDDNNNSNNNNNNNKHETSTGFEIWPSQCTSLFRLEIIYLRESLKSKTTHVIKEQTL